ncbi:RNA recognition motif domain-containing protein [Desulfurispira natronophila]|uniref:RNA recognition motif-containing protein n=1 Tax=Desulfurispira natronophila TaxID=682562 RepID=A0A7W7Y2G9_9BACT|nr:RNA-binding protein [Desulfurispira natronophila]MBB5020885.1 RNA recognition motif-containing protein [Desulfurispira natronophila]
MTKSIYAGNLPFSTTEDEIGNLFAQYGDVYSVKLISDRETGRLRGFGFVEMDEKDCAAAVEGLNGYELSGRQLRVNEARPKSF